MRPEQRTSDGRRLLAAAVGAGVLVLGLGVPTAVAAFADPARATSSFTAATLGRPANARCTGTSLTTASIAWDAVPGVDAYLYTPPGGPTETLSASTTTHAVGGTVVLPASFSIVARLQQWTSVATTVTVTAVGGTCVSTTT